jgi:hypothetical protein
VNILIKGGKTPTLDPLLSFINGGMSVFSLLGGWYFLALDLPNAQKKRRIVVCEYGFFQVAKEPWKKQVDVIHWWDVLDVRKPAFGELSYTIIRREHGFFSLDVIYQDSEELVDVIKQRARNSEYDH